MCARAVLFLLLSTTACIPVAHSLECQDEHTQMLTLIWLHTISEYPADVVTKEAVTNYRIIIDKATRPEDAILLQEVCLMFTGMMHTAWGIDAVRTSRDIYKGCPDGTVDKMLARYEAVNDPNTFDKPVSEYLPTVRVSPVYPKKALEQGLSGSVTLAFTVRKNGTVSRPKVVESTDKLFERPAIKAVKDFKYNPRRKNGVPLETRGVKTKITFTHPDDEEPSNCPEYGPPALLPDEELEILSLAPSE